MEGVGEAGEVKKAEGGEGRVEGADFTAWSRCGGVTRGSEKAAGAETGSQKASRSGLMSKGTGVTGSRPAELHLPKHEGSAEGGDGGARGAAERGF